MHLRVQILPGLPRLSRPVQILLPGWAELALPVSQKCRGNERLEGLRPAEDLVSAGCKSFQCYLWKL